MRRAKVKSFLIDGFPRAIDQAQVFEREIQECDCVLFFDCPLEVMQERLLERAKTSGRADDNLETIKKRFDTFQSSSLPVLDYYKEENKTVKLSAVPPPDEVYAGVKFAMASLGVH